MEDFGSALEKNAAELTVMDVYDIAAVVGQEFERIIDQHGCEALARLMPKVVRVLEILEVLVSRNNINPETEELRLELDRLRLERMDRMEKERKHKKELELVEDVWRGEAQDLLTQITQLQEENKNLLTNLSPRDASMTVEAFHKQEGMSERERQVMKKLKEVVDKQRDEIRAKDRELTLKNEDIEALQQQQNRLMKINHDLRHKITVVEAQGKALIEQKVELEAFLQTHEQEMSKLRTEIGKLREKLQGEPSHNGEKPKVESIIEEESAAEKMASELKDPNRPRFTLQELRDVLHERNELKAKVFLLQEELAYYKSEEIEEETGPPTPTPPPVLHSRPATQPESGIKRLFSFFSRDKKRNSQRNVRFEDTFSAWADKEDAYTEQGQEALQHL
ncbi:RILP-like protein 1 isoform X1 [Acipenser oxyrinchus oxyrinchus]|uniref:RILP-like protein 1 n=1 Tax=Acipenser oxyrinchus oxyrinchus TaxID=40147 RepID=A0AAD8D0N6_ACIOX|nr:RILP-like protein 1 isoform X1 [Acipenser oxyrinchus oxyrinchus]